LFLRRLKTGQAQRGPSAADSKCRLPIYPVSVVIHKRVYLVQAAWQFNKLCFSGMQPFECLQFCTRKPPVEAAVVVTYLQFSTQVCFLFSARGRHCFTDTCGFNSSIDYHVLCYFSRNKLMMMMMMMMMIGILTLLPQYINQNSAA